MLPREALLKELKEKGYSSVLLLRKIKKINLQSLAVNILLEKGKIIEFEGKGKKVIEENGIKICTKGNEEKVDCAFAKEGKVIVSKEDLIEKIEKYPIFIIDLSFWNLHTEKEKKRLRKQVELSLNVIRDYLWDKNLILINSPFPVGKCEIKDKEFLKNLDDAVILDPNAEKGLTEDEIKKFKYFLIGGIVDLGRKWEGTKDLFKDLDYEKRKITLKGHIYGVPERINKIISIILKVRFKNMNLIDAIKSEQSKKDILQRLSIELPKMWTNKKVKEEDLRKLLEILNIDFETLKEYAKRYFRAEII